MASAINSTITSKYCVTKLTYFTILSHSLSLFNKYTLNWFIPTGRELATCLKLQITATTNDVQVLSGLFPNLTATTFFKSAVV